jgi:hypothetical protein
MTGPEHYLTAQRLMSGLVIGVHPSGEPKIRDDEPHTIAAAQVHALLALTAATASGTMNRGEWFSATLTIPKEPS